MRRLIFVFSSLSGCVSNGVQPLKPLEIATAPYSPIINATSSGSLEYERGCLSFYDDSRHQILVPIWPEGTIFNGTSVMFHKPGKADQPIVLDQAVMLSGRPLTWPTVPNPRAALIERQCGGTPFAVADVAPAD